jgi:hypothetical protein
MPTWGDVVNSRYKYKDMMDEKTRQQNVVKKFIADHPEYDPTNESNNEVLVDFIESSQRPFTDETIEWAYESLRVNLDITPEPVYDKDIVPTVTGRRIKNDD